MQVLKLSVSNFRNIEQADVEPHPHLNFILGPNGAGKTSLLETLVLLSKGRSFRSGNHKDLIGPINKILQLHCLLENKGKTHRLGIERGASSWRGRLDGEDMKQRSGMAHLLPHVLFEPNSHLLVDGGPDYRRRYLDWSVFHVKPAFLSTWYRFHRCLKQRNALLKRQHNSENNTILDALDKQLAESAESISAFRRQAFNQLRPIIMETLPVIAPDIPELNLEYNKGWRGEGYLEYLQLNRQRDIDAGQTLGGPHRANIDLLLFRDRIKDRFSRGQQKALASALLIAQTTHLKKSGIVPIILLDDPASEFDSATLSRLLRDIYNTNNQMWITSVEPKLPAWIDELSLSQTDYTVFHVEHGKFQKMV